VVDKRKVRQHGWRVRRAPTAQLSFYVVPLVLAFVVTACGLGLAGLGPAVYAEEAGADGMGGGSEATRVGSFDATTMTVAGDERSSSDGGAPPSDAREEAVAEEGSESAIPDAAEVGGDASDGGQSPVDAAADADDDAAETDAATPADAGGAVRDASGAHDGGSGPDAAIPCHSYTDCPPGYACDYATSACTTSCASSLPCNQACCDQHAQCQRGTTDEACGPAEGWCSACTSPEMCLGRQCQ
jgi:hypothetical protein